MLLTRGQESHIVLELFEKCREIDREWERDRGTETENKRERQKPRTRERGTGNEIGREIEKKREWENEGKREREAETENKSDRDLERVRERELIKVYWLKNILLNSMVVVINKWSTLQRVRGACRCRGPGPRTAGAAGRTPWTSTISCTRPGGPARTV